MMADLMKLTRSLYPTGRAFRIPREGNLEAIHAGLAISEQEAIDALLTIFDSLLADNENFDEELASLWERRLGIISSPFTSLEDRRAAIRRKYNKGLGLNRAKLARSRMEAQLQAANFNLNVFENLAGNSPNDDIGTLVGLYQHGQRQHGQQTSGGLTGLDIIANHIEPSRDLNFQIGNPRRLFYVGGPTFPEFVDVPESRYLELRQLIMSIKPLHMVGILLVNIVPDPEQRILADDTWNDDGIWVDDAPFSDI
jgi:hypothetical protein